MVTEENLLLNHGKSQSGFFSVILIVAIVVRLGLLSPALLAEDWPEWRGKGRSGSWNETGILKKFPKEGLRILWRVPIGGGYSGPSVSNGRVFVSDFKENLPLQGIERLICLDEKTGKVLWSHSWKADYSQLMSSYATGPRATPTVDAGLVYVVGAMGVLKALATDSGELVWEKNFEADFGTKIPTWGVTSSPLVEEDLLICIVGGSNNSEVVAFNKFNGKEIWRALSAEPEMGYAQPLIFQSGGVHQLIIWTPKKLSALNPENGSVFWEESWESRMGLTVATPVRQDNHLFLSQFFGGSMMLKLDPVRPSARVVWKRKGKSELPQETDGLHALITTPVLQGDLIIGVCSYGQLRALDVETGDRLWESLDMIEFGRWAAAFFVRNGDRYFVNNDLGYLIIARFDKEGYHEIDRTHLIEPTTGGRGRRDRLVNWSHPAYANGHILARNDRNIIRASLLD